MSKKLNIQAEEARRNRNGDSCERWNAILQTIEFAEVQQPVKRNSKKACLERQAFLNRDLQTKH